ncbi:hypothetical protein AGDE_15196 [Angomonas deanei]|nr:hypothetical protein AGDE_15196 [Angomonas deanei]|eukprot:EPY19541.1 hypothetical protein AGDE_15196 [Angomonas deanei]
MNRYENVVPAQIRGQRILAFSCKLPCLHLSLLEEELRVGETSSTRRPFTTKSLVMRNVKIGGEQFIQSQTYTVVASSFAIKENRSDEGKQQVEQDLFRMGCHDPADGDGRRDPNVFIAIELLSQPGNYPSLMKSTVKCRPLEEGSMHVEVCSALMESLELLYDLSGVLFDKALNYNNRILCCTPWHRDQWSPEHSRAVEEEYTTNRCTGGQFCQTWELHIPSNVFRLYYPKDEEEFCQAEEAASWGDTPFLTYSCDAVKVEFHQTTAMKTTTMTLGNSKLQAAYLAEDGSLQWNEVLLPDENCQMHVTFEVNSCVPSLSLSDFIANGGDADTPEGVRATHHLRIQSSGNFMLYTQHEMMRWVELGTKGVVSRGMSILERQPFLYALPERQENAVQPAPLLPWPRPKDTLVQPYTWCVMKKTMSFEALRLRLTTSDEGSNGSLASTKDTVSVKVKRLRVEDQWDNTPVEKEAKPETISSHMVITFTNMIGLESASVRLHTMFSHLQFRF